MHVKLKKLFFGNKSGSLAWNSPVANVNNWKPSGIYIKHVLLSSFSVSVAEPVEVPFATVK